MAHWGIVPSPDAEDAASVTDVEIGFVRLSERQALKALLWSFPSVRRLHLVSISGERLYSELVPTRPGVLDNLEVLRITDVRVSWGFLCALVCSCPALDTLILERVDMDDNHSVTLPREFVCNATCPTLRAFFFDLVDPTVLPDFCSRHPRLETLRGSLTRVAAEVFEPGVARVLDIVLGAGTDLELGAQIARGAADAFGDTLSDETVLPRINGVKFSDTPYSTAASAYLGSAAKRMRLQ